MALSVNDLTGITVSFRKEWLKVLLPSLLFSIGMTKVFITGNWIVLVILSLICVLFSYQMANNTYEYKRLQMLEATVNEVLKEKGFRMNSMAEVVPLESPEE